MIRELLIELKKSCFSVLPIYLLVLFLLLVGVISLTGYEILSFSLATILLILGISLFNYGADHAMTPIGKYVGKGLTKQGKIWVLFLVVFLFGFNKSYTFHPVVGILSLFFQIIVSKAFHNSQLNVDLSPALNVNVSFSPFF